MSCTLDVGCGNPSTWQPAPQPQPPTPTTTSIVLLPTAAPPSAPTFAPTVPQSSSDPPRFSGLITLVPPGPPSTGCPKVQAFTLTTVHGRTLEPCSEQNGWKWVSCPAGPIEMCPVGKGLQYSTSLVSTSLSGAGRGGGMGTTTQLALVAFLILQLVVGYLA